MRTEFFATPIVLSLEEMRLLAPWASAFPLVEGGFLAFESLADYEVWLEQI